MAITDVLKDDDIQHLVEAVGDALAIFLTDFLCVKVGCDDGEPLREVAILQQVNDGIGYVAVVQHLCRLFAEVIDGKQPLRTQSGIARSVLVYIHDIPGIDQSQLEIEIGVCMISIFVKVTTLFEVSDGCAQGKHQCCLAVATRAAQHHAELRIRLGEVMRHLPQVVDGVLVKLYLVVTCLNLEKIVRGKQVQGFLLAHIELKTSRRSPTPFYHRHQFLDERHIYLGFQIVRPLIFVF